MRGLGGILVVAALLLPLVHAAPATATFLVQGPVELPAARTGFVPLAIFSDETSALHNLTGTFPHVRLRFYEATFLEVPVASFQLKIQPDARQSGVFSNATLRQVGSHAGFIGFYPDEASATLTTHHAWAIEPKERSEFSTALGSNQREEPVDSPYYTKTVDRPHLAWESPGLLAYRGAGTLQLMGGAFTFEADGRERTYVTGLERRSEEGRPEAVYRWLVLEFDDSALEAASTHPWSLAAHRTESAWTGRASFNPVAGEMNASGVGYATRGGEVGIEGTFTSFLEVEMHDGTPMGRLTLEGDVSATTLGGFAAAAPSAARTGASAPVIVGLGLLAATVASGVGFAGGALYGSRRRARPAPLPASVAIPLPIPASVSMPFTAEDCCDAGAKAASEEDWAGAAKWFARAHALAPTSARICADLAFALSQIGDVEEALRLYERASRLSADGEADFNGALAALHGARPLGEIESWLERALERTPGLVTPLESDDDFLVLRGRPRFERAVRRAWERLADDPPAGGPSLP